VGAGRRDGIAKSCVCGQDADAFYGGVFGMQYKTEQELFWAGEFGNSYIERNTDSKYALSSNIHLGRNASAIGCLLPDCEISAVEINKRVVKIMKERFAFPQGGVRIYEQSMLDFIPDYQRDFAGEMMDSFKPNLRLLDYGFVYHRDAVLPCDDLNWFLMEKQQ
jgi:spore coat polysaccharide biosynthesis protein SpsF